MKTFQIIARQTDTYSHVFNVKAETEQAAIEQVEKDLKDGEGLETMRDTLDDSDLTVEVYQYNDVDSYSTQQTVGHTPGPWKFFEKSEIDKSGTSHKYCPSFIVESEKFVVELSYPHKAYVGELVSQERKKVAEANARLIAAAPELLEALKSILPYAENEAAGLADVDESSLANKAWRKIAKASKAIAKAEGK